MRTSSPDTALSLLREATPEFGCTAKVAQRLPHLAANATGGHAGQPVAEIVATGEFAVAETGSVAVNEPAEDRGACFLAERLWLLVPEAEIVPTLDQGMRRMRELVVSGAHHPLFMSGPSRTADIERVLTIGVHGPRALVIVVVGGM